MQMYVIKSAKSQVGEEVALEAWAKYDLECHS